MDMLQTLQERVAAQKAEVRAGLERRLVELKTLHEPTYQKLLAAQKRLKAVLPAVNKLIGDIEKVDWRELGGRPFFQADYNELQRLRNSLDRELTMFIGSYESWSIDDIIDLNDHPTGKGRPSQVVQFRQLARGNAAVVGNVEELAGRILDQIRAYVQAKGINVEGFER